jgi:hypothetical protein
MKLDYFCLLTSYICLYFLASFAAVIALTSN